MNTRLRVASVSIGLLALALLLLGLSLPPPLWSVSSTRSPRGAAWSLRTSIAARRTATAITRTRSRWEDRIIEDLGGVYGPYTGRWFASKFDTDIEHMVARSEAHDSGLCAADSATRRRFATDLVNLTLAGENLNRYEKRHFDAAEWLPDQNRCWFAARVIAVRQQYGLTIDRREADALDDVLAECTSTDLVVFARGETPAAAVAPSAQVPAEIAAWDDNGNGRISCTEARAHGIAPVRRGHPAYPFMRDGDGDGVVCESGSSRAAPPRAPAAGRATGAGCGPFPNCTALRRVHPNGVQRGHCAYQRRMDRDNDGWACER